jgi:hypothetical protein
MVMVGVDRKGTRRRRRRRKDEEKGGMIEGGGGGGNWESIGVAQQNGGER